MDTNYNNRIPFQAKLINRIKIYKTDDITYKKRPVKVSFVEINTKNDAEVLKQTSDYWGLDSKYSEDIVNTAIECTKERKDQYYNLSKVYALTYQKNNLHNLNPNSVIGMLEIRKLADKHISIPFIQVDPKIILPIFRDVHGVGSAMLKSLKGIYDKIQLRSSSTKSTRNFYKKNGFRNNLRDKDFFVWKLSLKERFERLFNFLSF